MWLEEQLNGIWAHEGPTIIVAPLVFGAAHIIAALEDETMPLVWLELAANDADDPVAQGNKLEAAVKRALGSALLPSGVPADYGVQFLKRHLSLLGPLVFAVTGSEHAPSFAETLLTLDQADNRVVLSLEAPPPGMTFPGNARVLTADQLRLTQQQALDLTERRLSDREALKLWRQSKGAYATFTTLLHARLSLPAPVRPSPYGPHLPPGYDLSVDADKLLDVLVAKGRWLEALDLAAKHVPDAVPGVLAEAGHIYHEHGLHQRLDGLLASLPERIAHHERVLRWRLVASARLGRASPVREAVRQHLARHDAPELRTVYAATVRSPSEREAESRRAFEAAPDPLTAFQYGRLVRDPEQATAILRQAVELAETQGRPYEVIRNAGALAAHYLHLGRYRDAVHWGGWALEQFDQRELADGQRRLVLLNDWSYARLLVGDTVGLEHPLREAEPHLDLAYPELGRLFRSTLGDYLVATGRPAGALAYYRHNWQSAPRHEIGIAALGMTRALIEVGEMKAACEIAERAVALTEHEDTAYHLPAVLAHGMALTFKYPERAAACLRTITESRDTFVSARYVAQASLYLAYAILLTGDIPGAKQILRHARPALQELAASGYRLLSGPEAEFRTVWQLFTGEGAALELRLLGDLEVWFDGRRVHVLPQWGEILAILALNAAPRGLTLEQLHLMLMGDRGNPKSLKATLAKMRRELPITRHPYQLAVPYTTDVERVWQSLKAGQVREALTLYRGPLLPASEAAALLQARDALDEAVRQAVIASCDPDALLELAERSDDDLELWREAQEQLDNHDPRTPLVRARIRQVMREWST